MDSDRRNDVPTVADLSPPILTYPYFEGPNLPAFDPVKAEYSPVNAWWLAEASLLAYGGPELFERVRNTDNLLAREHIRLQSLDDGHENGVLLLSAEGFVIVAFRGTRVLGLQDPLVLHKSIEPHVRDVVTDLHFSQVDFVPGKVHRGFLEAYDKLADQLNNRLANWRERDIWFTGHSLGAALATIASARDHNFRGLYTFGSPRVGDEMFGTTFTGKQCFRIVHNNDLVARLPPPIVPWIPPANYRHVGQLVFIDRDGMVDPSRDPDSIFDLGTGQVDFESIRQACRDMVDDMAEIIAYRTSIKNPTNVRVPRNAVTDHAPIYYARHMKNQLSG